MARRKMKSKRKLYEKKIVIIDENGIERRKSIYAKTQGDLDAKVDKAKDDNKRGLYRNADITVSQYSEKWLGVIEDKCAVNTYKSYMYSVQHIRETIGAIQLRRLKRQDIQTAIDSFKDQPRTAQVYKMTINRICESAIDDLIIARNPCRGLVLPKYKAKEKRTLTQIEIDAFESADFDAEERLFVSLLYYCGLRRGEVLALGRGDIDLNNSMLTVNHSLGFDGNKGILKEPKTEKSKRSIPIPPQLKELIQSYKYDLYLFMRNGDYFTHSAFVKMWARILKKMNTAAGGEKIDKIQGLTPHIFRHNYASLLYKQGIKVKEAQKLLGHSTIAVTMDIYTHLAELDKETISAIEDAFTARRA